MNTSIQTLLKFCNIFSHTQPYPLQILYQGELLWTSLHDDLVSFLTDYKLNLEQTDDIFLYHAKDLLLFGGVWNKDHSILLLLGPTLNMPLQEESIHAVIKNFHLSIEKRPDVAKFFTNNSGISLGHFRMILEELCFFINRELPDTHSNIYSVNDDLQNELNRKTIEISTSVENPLEYQCSYEFEQQLLDNIRRGNIDEIQRIANSPQTHQGNLNFYSTRYIKDMFICAVTLAARAAINGGLALETAYQLSDFYIQTVENVVTAKEVYELMDTMYLDYVRRTHDSKLGVNVPNDLDSILQYIRHGTHIPLKVSDVAEFAHLSVSQLERRFKSTLGFLPADFILRCKMEEAKNLLKYTNKSISEISQILAFSSQAYFTNVFKKAYGCTPKEFRNKK